ncbi:hypothetical protein BKA81DRAFT_98143 [Phyllosticta paracitricarpa]
MTTTTLPPPRRFEADPQTLSLSFPFHLVRNSRPLIQSSLIALKLTLHYTTPACLPACLPAWLPAIHATTPLSRPVSPRLVSPCRLLFSPLLLSSSLCRWKRATCLPCFLPCLHNPATTFSPNQPTARRSRGGRSVRLVVNVADTPDRQACTVCSGEFVASKDGGD